MPQNLRKIGKCEKNWQNEKVETTFPHKFGSYKRAKFTNKALAPF